MKKQFRIIGEYEVTAPIVGVRFYDTVEEACDRVAEIYMNCRRVWVCEVTVYSDNSVRTELNEILVAENGIGVGPLAA